MSKKIKTLKVESLSNEIQTDKQFVFLGNCFHLCSAKQFQKVEIDHHIHVGGFFISIRKVHSKDIAVYTPVRKFNDSENLLKCFAAGQVHRFYIGAYKCINSEL